MRSSLPSLLCLAAATAILAAAPPSIAALRVGLLLPLSGPMAPAGQAARTAAEMGGQDTGGIDLKVVDTAGTAKGGRSAAKQLIASDRVHVMAGALSSPAAWAAAAVAESSGVPLLIFGAAATAITEPPWQYVFRINPPVEEKFAALASFLDRFSLKDRSTVVFCEDRPPAMALSEMWLSAAATAGLDPLFRIPFAPDLVDYRPELARARVKKPSIAVLIASAADGALMLRQGRQLNLAPALVLGDAAGFARPEFAAAGEDSTEYVCTLLPWAPSVPHAGVRRFVAAYRNRYGQSPGHHQAQAFAAMQVVADAAARAGKPSRSAIRRALSTANLATICGQVRFDPNSARPGQNRSSWLIVQWQSGRLETVWPPDKASADPVFPFPPWRSDRRTDPAAAGSVR